MKKLKNRKFRVAILGAGNISVEHAAVLNWLPNTEVIAVCDLDQDRAENLSVKFNIPNVYTTLEEMLEKVKPDVVHVLLPPGEHVRFSTKCLQAGSNVFVEKPLGISVNECNELLQIANNIQLSLGVNHNLLYMNAVQQLIEQVKLNRFGRLIHVNISWSMPPSKLQGISPSSFFLQAPQNPLFEWGVHPLSIINYLLGKVIQAETLVSDLYDSKPSKEFYTTWQSSLRCDRGTAQLLISVGQGFDHLWVDVLGEDAFAHLDLMDDSIIIKEYMPYRPTVASFFDAYSKSVSLFKNATINMKNYVFSGLGLPVPAASPNQAGMRNSIKAYYSALSSGTKPAEGIENGTAVVEYCERIYKSSFSSTQKEVDDGK